MQGNFVPVLIQWRGEGPEPVSGGSGTRNLRSSSEPTAAQLFYQRRMQSAPSNAEIESVLATRRLEEKEYNHVVTFKDCVFRVSDCPSQWPEFFFFSLV
jgi:hypothetical protein